MHGNSKLYEQLVRDLLAARLRVDYPSADLQVWHDRRYPGKSGHEHQIDVSARLTLAGLSILILVECKYYSHRVGVDEVMELAYRLQDVGAQKGILVTTVGFQEGAIKVAKAQGIALVQAKELEWHPILPVLPADWFETHRARQHRFLVWMGGYRDAVEVQREMDGLGLELKDYEMDWNQVVHEIGAGSGAPLRYGYQLCGLGDDHLVLDADGLFSVFLLERGGIA